VNTQQEEVRYARGEDISCPRCTKAMNQNPRAVVIGKFITCASCGTDWHVANYIFEGFLAGSFGLIPIDILPEKVRAEYYTDQARHKWEQHGYDLRNLHNQCESCGVWEDEPGAKQPCGRNVA
jgi:hypothetical protein